MAQRLLCDLREASHTWVPPLKYPISDDFDGGRGLDFTSRDERGVRMDVLTNNLFVLVVIVLCVLFISLT